MSTQIAVQKVYGPHSTTTSTITGRLSIHFDGVVVFNSRNDSGDELEEEEQVLVQAGCSASIHLALYQLLHYRRVSTWVNILLSHRHVPSRVVL